MDISKIITICAFCAIFGVEFVLSSPTFGGEHVHIKVHIPHEVSSTKSKHTVIHHAPKHHAKHKVIHHYHSHQRPVKTQAIKEKAPLLENLYLAELDKPHIQEHSYHHGHGPQHKEETFLVKEQHHHHVKPIEEINTVKVIEEHEHHHKHQPHLEYGKHHVETIKLIESGNDHHYHEDQDHDFHVDQDHHFHEDHDYHYQEDQDHRVETVKFVEEKPQYHYHHEEKPVNYEYHEPKDEVIKVIEAPKYKSAAHHYGHEPQVEEVVVEEEQNYHDYHTPQTETVKIVETKPTVPKGYYNNYDPEDQLLHGIIEESLEIIKTKIAKNHNYGNHYQTHYGYQQPKEQEISKPHEKYHHYQKVPATNYHYSHQPDVTVEEHIEYEKPNSHHYSQHTSTSGSLEPAQHYASHSAVYEEQSHDNKHKYPTDYKPKLPSSETAQDFNESHMEYQKQNTLYEDLNTKDDYSKDVENPHAPETYVGHDSYSAGHVQGLGSGGYRYHMP